MSGAPYVFARLRAQKPFHTETRVLPMRGALCQNGCGLYYVAPSDAEMKREDVCPDCSEPPKPWRVGSDVELVEVVVRMAFGNVRSIDFVRSLGKAPIATVQRRSMPLPISIARVTPAAESPKIVRGAVARRGRCLSAGVHGVRCRCSRGARCGRRRCLRADRDHR